MSKEKVNNFNPRGYAFTSLRGAWRHMQSWDWHVMLSQIDAMPNEYEYVDQGLAIFDSMILGYKNPTEAEVKEVVHTVVKYMSQELRSYKSGVLKRQGDNKFRFHYGLHLDTPKVVNGRNEEDFEVHGENEWLIQDEDQYAEVDDALALQFNLRMLGMRLDPQQLAMVTEFLDAARTNTVNRGGLKDAAEVVLGESITPAKSNSIWRAIRNKCKDLELHDGTLREVSDL